MKPLRVRKLSEAERVGLQAGLKSESGFRVRRSQMIWWSVEEGLSVKDIAERLGCSGQAEREALDSFEERGLASLQAEKRARHDDQRAFKDAGREQVRTALQQSPRGNGYDTSLWTLDLLAELSAQQGWSEWLVQRDTMSETLRRMGIVWTRAKHWISSPDPHYDSKKTTRLAKNASSTAPRLVVSR